MSEDLLYIHLQRTGAVIPQLDKTVRNAMVANGLIDRAMSARDRKSYKRTCRAFPDWMES